MVALDPRASHGLAGGYVQPAGQAGRQPLSLLLCFEYLISALIVATYAQGWAGPLTGWAVDPTKLTLLKIGFLPAYGMTALLFVMYPLRSLWAVARTPVIYGLVILAAVSVLWSIDGAATQRRVVALVFTTLAGSVLAARWNMRQLTEIIAAQFAVYMALSFLFALAPPHHGIMTELFPGAWRGVWTEKNGLGALMAMGALSCLAAAILAAPRRMFWLLMFAGCVALLLLSRSKTSLASLVLGVAVIAFVGLVRRGPVMAVVATWLGVAGALTLGGILVLAPQLIFDLLGKDATLTGRTEIWTAAMRQGMLNNPNLGFGYGVLWDHREAYDPASWIAHDAGFVAGHAHNGWLEVWLGLGFLGLGIWALAYLGNLLRMVGSIYTTSMAYSALPFFLVFSVFSITEVSVIDYHDISWTIYVAFAAMLSSRHPAEEVAR
jgi:exopolysaccharide production protein ExoQ